MKFFNFFKSVDNKKPTVDLEHLTPEGELPWGWYAYTKEFTDKINTEYSYFLNMWLDSKNKSPKELYSALKSFILYLEDVEKLCKTKGECFEFWYYEILTTKDYAEKRKKELEELTTNLDHLQEIYIKKQKLLPTVIELLKANDGILQSEFKELFDEPFQSDVSNILYQMHKDGKLEKTKHGKSYILHYKE
ncbi:MAG: hypothetical protein E7391_06310 [Ruminococcaceae bacterium]|nr:hypothetical protein [Oscillospiraceae bacterium]